MADAGIKVESALFRKSRFWNLFRSTFVILRVLLHSSLQLNASFASSLSKRCGRHPRVVEQET